MQELTYRPAGAVTLAVCCWTCPEPTHAAVLLLPGTGDTATTWDLIAFELSRDRNVFAVDLRGHGRSDWPGTYSIDLMAQDVAALIPTLAVEVDVVGHSLGGLVGCRLVAGHTSSVRRLVLEDVGVPHPRTPANPPRPEGELPFDWKVVEQVRPEIDHPDPGWPHLLRGIQIPVLAISGGATSFLPEEHVAELARTVAEGTHTMIDAGHEIHTTRPREFLERIKAFLDG